MSLFDEVIGFEILGGFDNDLENDALTQRAEELGLDVDDYDTLEELKDAIEELE
ncbi:MAG: caspase family protein [Clostridiales bacterium]|nr:caspase family protein [Clostridiales bacterium]